MCKTDNIKPGKRTHLSIYIAALLLLITGGLFYRYCCKTSESSGTQLEMNNYGAGVGSQYNDSIPESDHLPLLVFAPHWLPQAQFAGFYVAKEKGFYASKGIDVEIIHPTASVNNMQYLLNGKADIASSFLVTAMKHKQSGIDLVNIAQLSQHSAIMFVTKKNSGVRDLRDFEGKRVGVWLSGFQETPMALIREQELSVDWVPVLSTVNLFLLDGIDALTVMWYNEYHQLYLSGIDHDELNHFFMSDYGFNIPEDGIYVLDETFRQRHNDLTKFVEATLEGWDYASAHKDYTVDLVVRLMQEANIPANRTHQSWMLEKVLEAHCHLNKGIPRTLLEPKDFEQALNLVKNHHQLDQSIDYKDFFRPVISLQP